MAEEKRDAGAGAGAGGVAGAGSVGGDGSSSAARVSTSFGEVGEGRQRFSIELKPDETTIVSWKKLVKESAKANPPSVAQPPSGAHPALHSRIAPPGQPPECEGNDAPPTSRFSAVIEKIERLYVGNESSEEEELADVPDDDQYDTEDSFIDDADLDEYFEVDKSTTKHKGFFINKGKLERLNELSSSPKQQPKKRRRKDSTNHSEKNDDSHSNKHAKVGNVRMKAAARTAPLVGSKLSSPQSLAGQSEHYHDEKSLTKSHPPVGPSKKKSSDSSVKLEQHVSSEMHRDQLESKDNEKHKIGVVQSRDLCGKLKASAESVDPTQQIYLDKNSISQVDTQPKRLLNDTKELEQSTKIRPIEKSSGCESPKHNLSKTKDSMQTTKSPSAHLKDGVVRPKGTMLERAIRDLEDIVKESRPPTADIQDADGSSQGVKRRLTREVKQKLAKVARLAQSSLGKISDELINRLMGIVGHIMQRKTLKRNLREMVVLGLSAKQEKDVKFQQIKKEVVEMIRVRAPCMISQVSGQHNGVTDDFQEVRASEEKGVQKLKSSMDNALEDKLCDLYDLYVEGMDEDKNSQVRKLYVELAELWPNGTMDNHGIKNAVCRSKARKRATHTRLKNQEKLRQQKLTSGARMEDGGSGEASSLPQPHPVQERATTDSNSQVLTSPNRIMANVTTVNQQSASPGMPSHSSANGSSLNRPRQEKIKGSSGAILDEAKKTTDPTLVKKKVKRKPEFDMNFPPEKVPSQEGKERNKLNKQDLNQPINSDFQFAGFSGNNEQFR